MAPEEHIRHDVQNRLAKAIGAEAASYVMTHLSPDEWPNLATKADIEGLRAATKADIEGLGAATKADIEGLGAATKADIATASDSLRQDFGTEFRVMKIEAAAFQDNVLQRFETADANMRTAVADLGSVLRKEIANQTRTMVVALTTIMITLAAVFIAAGG